MALVQTPHLAAPLAPPLVQVALLQRPRLLLLPTFSDLSSTARHHHAIEEKVLGHRPLCRGRCIAAENGWLEDLSSWIDLAKPVQGNASRCSAAKIWQATLQACKQWRSYWRSLHQWIRLRRNCFTMGRFHSWLRGASWYHMEYRFVFMTWYSPKQEAWLLLQRMVVTIRRLGGWKPMGSMGHNPCVGMVRTYPEWGLWDSLGFPQWIYGIYLGFMGWNQHFCSENQWLED